MQSFKQIFKAPLQPVPAKVAVVLLVIALIGFADAGYLTIEHYQNVIPPCSITGGCEKVLTSSYSSVLGLPVSLLGAIYYCLMAIGVFAYLEGRRLRILRLALLASGFGLLASIWFVILQAFVIHSYCLYCLGSALTSTVLFIVSYITLHRYAGQEATSLTVS